MERCEVASHMAELCDCERTTKSLNAMVTCVCDHAWPLLAPDTTAHQSLCQLDLSVHV